MPMSLLVLAKILSVADGAPCGLRGPRPPRLRREDLGRLGAWAN
jgi:hypothetical protein